MELSAREREFLIWALGFVEGATSQSGQTLDTDAAGLIRRIKEEVDDPPATVHAHTWDTPSDDSLQDPNDLESRGPLRYVELVWRSEDGVGWTTSLIVEATKPNAAWREAKRLFLIEHPGHTEVEEFLQRKISGRTAVRIRRRMDDGTWRGWLGHGKMKDKVEEDDQKEEVS
jgi:hypothetical protein